MGDKPRYSDDVVRETREQDLRALFGKALDVIRAAGGDIGASAPTWEQLRPQLDDAFQKRGLNASSISRMGDVVVFGGAFALTIAAAPVSGVLSGLAAGTYVLYWAGRRLMIEAFPSEDMDEPPKLEEFLKKKVGS